MLVFAAEASFAQQTAPQGAESHKYRTILAIAGSGGGFALGVFGGIAAFDDATYASRKVWTTALVSAAGGAVGGYFLGRFLDKRKKDQDVAMALPWTPDVWNRNLIRNPWSDVQQLEPHRFPASPDVGIANTPCFRESSPAILLSAKRETQ